MPQFAAAVAVGAAHQRFQARGDFNQRERFAKIVIGAEPKPFDTLVERVAGGEDQYRFVAAFVAPFAQNNGVVRGVVQRGFALFAAGKPVDAEAQLGQAGFKAVADQFVVFHQ